MAGELQVAHSTGATVYSLIRDTTAQVWDTVDGAFEAYATAQIANYDVALTEQGTASGYYAGTFPSAIDAGSYNIAYFEQAGGAPAEGDTLIGTEVIEWDGTQVLPRAAWALVEADPIAKARTWIARFDQDVCREVHEVNTSTTAVYAMDFSPILNPGTSISATSSVTDTSGNSLTTSSLTLSQNKMKAHFTVSASDLAASKTYPMKVTVTTTDGQTLSRTGTLKTP